MLPRIRDGFHSGTASRSAPPSFLCIRLITTMNKLVSLALLCGGIVLVVYGVSASESFGSDVSRFFTGSPTDKAIWMLIVGGVAAVVGAGGLVRGSAKTP